MLNWRRAGPGRTCSTQATIKRTIGRTPAAPSRNPTFERLDTDNSLHTVSQMKDDVLMESVRSVLDGHKKSHLLLRNLLTELGKRKNLSQATQCLKVMEQSVFSKARDPIIATFLSHRFLEHGHEWSASDALEVFTFSACYASESGANYPDPSGVDFLVQRFWDTQLGWTLTTRKALRLLRALVRINYPDETLASLAEYTSGKMDEVTASEITDFGWILQQKTFGDNLDIVLIADLTKVAARRIEELDVSAIQLVMYNCARQSYYDEYFLSRASQRLQEPSTLRGCAQSCLAGLIQNVGALQWKDPALGDALCNAVTQHIKNDLSEHFAQKVIFGLMKMRHKNEDLFLAIARNLEPNLSGFRDTSLSRILSAFSLFHVFDLQFHLALLNELVKRLHQLQPVSIQHLITGLQRFEPDFVKHGMGEWLSDILKQTAEVIISRGEASGGTKKSISPIQSLAILMAFRKMRFREPEVLSKIVGAFIVPTDQQWPKEYRIFYPAHAWHQLPPCPFDVVKTKELWETGLDINAAVQVATGLSSLECWSAESLWLGLYLKYWAEDRLHDMKAKEVLAFADAFRDWNLPDNAIAYAAGVFNGKLSPTNIPHFSRTHTWRGSLMSSCMENLRRHEYFVSTTWWVLCRLKVLDMSFRVLGSNVGFEEFRRRLCDLSIEDSQRLKEDLEEDAEDESIDAVPSWSPGPIEQCSRWSIQENALIDGFRVDVLIRSSE